jgi:DHA3 family tetracycline resistance protein-like MFS transporter
LLLALLGIGLFYGLYSEGFDRLWTPHLLESFALPSWLEGMDAVVWFGVIRGVLAVVSLVATEVVRRRVDTNRSASLGQALMWNAGGIVLALAGFGLTRSFRVAVVFYWAVGVLRSIRWPLASTWFNQRIDDPQVRATMFSVRGQVDAVGQITSGPVVGMIGNVSIRAALVASAAILSPVLPLYWIAIRRDE